MQSVRDAGGRPYGIPAGASVHPLGGLGYVGFAEEVRAQEAELGFAFDYIVVCVVTGSTQGGMIVGFAKDGRARNVIGIDASGTPRADPGAGPLDRRQHRQPRRARPRDPRRRDPHQPGLRLSGLRRPLGGDERGDPPSRPAPKR